MTPPYHLVSRAHRAEDTVIEIGEGRVGGGALTVAAGPCAVESHVSLLQTADGLRSLGVQLLRGGAFKPRTSPYAFRGLGADGLRVLAEVGRRTGMAVVTEVLDVRDVELVASYADVLQVGTRNMQNFALLEALGECGRPVLLKRGMAATVEELLCAAEYVVAAGNPNVMLCERGVRGFDPSTRATLDLNSVVVLKQLSHLPVLVDPSHATGRSDLVPGVALGAVAAGADGLIVEVHHDPARSIVDAAQTLDLATFGRLLDDVERVARAVGRRLERAPALPHATRLRGREIA